MIRNVDNCSSEAKWMLFTWYYISVFFIVHFVKGCRLQIILLLVLIPTHGCDITTCDRSGIIVYIFGIIIEIFILYWKLSVLL